MKGITIATVCVILACSGAAQTAVPLVSATGSSGRNLEFTREHRAIPHLAVGGVWTTTLTLVNLGLQQGTFIVGLNTTTGAPWRLFATGLGEAADFQITLPSAGSIDLEFPSRQANIETGWALISQPPNTLIGGHAIFTDRTPGRPVFEAVVPLNGGTDDFFVMPFDNTTGKATCLAVVNADAGPTLHMLRFVDPTGVHIALFDANYSAGQQRSLCLHTSPELTNRKGLIVSSTNLPAKFAVLGFRFDPGGAFTTLFPMRPRPQDLP